MKPGIFIRFLFNGLLVILLSGQSGCEEPRNYDNPAVVIETRYGNIVVELFIDKAPLTGGAFLEHIDSGYFKHTSFYRILRRDNQVTGSLHSHLIQGGVWEANPDLKEKFKPMPHESTDQTGILHKKGVISMARYEPGTATSEFFICMEDEPGFDHGGANNADGLGYAAFGRVVEGMDVVEKIYERPEYKQRFYPPVTILNIKRLPKVEQQ